MKRNINIITLLIFSISIFFNLSLKAQLYKNYCPNLSFDMQSFYGWTCQTANTKNASSTAYSNLNWTTTSPIYQRHTMMVDIYGFDENTCNGQEHNQLSLVHQSFPMCARIGNDTAKNQANAMSYTMIVDSGNAFLFIYFAVVFINSNDTSENQSRFEILIHDSLGNLLDIPCSKYTLMCDTNNPNLIKCGNNVYWQDWTTVGILLNSLIGQTIHITVMVANSTEGDGLAYAYLVGNCGASKVDVITCCYTMERIEAPEGFKTYEWRNSEGKIIGNKQRISLLYESSPDLSEFEVTMTSTCGYEATRVYRIIRDCVFPEFSCDTLNNKCYPTSIILNSLATCSHYEIIYWEWVINKAYEKKPTEYYNSIDSTFEYFFKDTGYYKIFYTAYSSCGSGDTASTIVYSYPYMGDSIQPFLAYTITKKECNTILNSTNTSLSNFPLVNAFWIVTNVSTDSIVYMAEGMTMEYLLTDSGYFKALLRVFNQNGCSDTVSKYIYIEEPLIKTIVYDTACTYYQYYDSIYTQSGEYKQVIEGIDCKDSIITLRLIIIDSIPDNIGPIIGDSIIKNTGNYTYRIQKIENTLYHWVAKEILSSGENKILDKINDSNQVTLFIQNTNPIELSVQAWNKCNTSNSLSLIINVTTNIIESSKEKQLTIYPNPTYDKLNIVNKNEKMKEIKVIDIVGKTVKHYIVNNTNTTIDISDLQKGLYIIWIKGKNEIKTAKIIKK